MRKTLIATAVGLALLVPFAPAAQASGNDGEIQRTGSCSGSADWKLDVKRDDGALEVEWEVDSNKVGQVWRVRIYDNGDRVAATRRTTLAPSGSFEVERRIANRAGDDRIVARARHLATGQVCRGVITFG
jgi:hypothetical protein